MPENPSYLDRLYNEIGQFGERFKGNMADPSNIIGNLTTPYQSMEEQARLRAQQEKEDYMAMQDSEQPQPEQPRPSIPGLEDPYLQYLEQNKAALTGPYLPQDQYAAPTREEYQKYFVEGQAPPKAVAVPSAVAEMAASAPRQAAARQQAPAQPQRPMTIGEQIDMLPFEGDRYEARRKVLEKAKQAKINEAYAYANSAYPGGTSSVEGDRFLKNALEQIKQTHIIPSPIEETESFKAAKEAIVSGKHADRLFMLAEMKGILEAAKNEKTKDGKVALLEPTMGKLLQSIAAGADAMQPAEAQRIISELTSIVQAPGESLEIIGRRGFFGAFSKDPDAFIEKASKILNATLPAVNERTAFYQNNLGSAFKKLGVGYVTPVGVKNQELDMTKLQQLREGRNVQQPIFSQTNPAADRPAPTGPQIVPGMRFGTAVPSSMIYGSTPTQVQGGKPMRLGY